MNRAQRRDSVRQEKFYFRVSSKSRLMSINEIINGSNDFIGLVPLVRQYLVAREDIDVVTRLTMERYLTFISERAVGNRRTLWNSSSYKLHLLRYPSNRCIMDPTIRCFSS